MGRVEGCYIQGVMKPIKKILNSHNVRVAQKPFQTLRHIFAEPEDPVMKEHEPTLLILFSATTLITSILDRPNISLVHI